MRYLLDTDMCIYIIKNRPERALRKLRSKAMEQVAVSTITVAELEYGVVKSRQPERNKIALTQFLIPFGMVDFDHEAARDYGRIRADLESRGSPIGPMDMLLAAQATSNDMVLVTNNDREFSRVKELRLENWVAE